MTLLVEEKSIVIPGEIIAEGMDHLPGQGTFRENDKVIASQLGLVNIDNRIIKVIAMGGRYIPRIGDHIIGKIINVGLGNWMIDIGYAYEASLSVKDATSEYIERGSDLSKYFDFSDLIMAKIVGVSKTKFVDLSMKGPGLRKLKGGKIINVIPTKIPRIIGKQGSMISMIKDATKCNIFVGKNGRIWIDGELENEILATKILSLIDKEAHTSGLTEKIQGLLKNGIQKKV